MFVASYDGDSGDSIVGLGHQQGDLLLVFAWRQDSTTVPSLDADYTSIGTATGGFSSTARAIRVAYRVSTGTETTLGTWTNAEQCLIAVYRGVNVADVVEDSDVFSTVEDWKSMTLAAPALVVLFRTALSQDVDTPSGFSERDTATGANSFSLFDSNGAVSSFSGATVTGTLGADQMTVNLAINMMDSGALFWAFP